ncbi:MAG: NAD(P)/FAD-dependent oxidoreductase [Bacillota bacterium]|nr:NAD(P)/FAD-dependent oxidoreductase [Bacillota bacterium]
MKVAIMGAGMSGLACAITLEQHGLTPAIFEKRNCVGDRFVNAEATFSILNRPVNNDLLYLQQNFNIHLRSTDAVKKLVIHSKNEIGSIDGNIGFVNIRGRHKESYENQLSKQVKSPIQFNSAAEYAQLCKEFDYVILAPGDGIYACELGNYRSDLTCTIRGATVEGDFLTDISHVWFNYQIIPRGYAWLIPFSEKEANLVIAYPDYPDNIRLDIDVMWNEFYHLACKQLDQNFTITDKFEINRYMMGICDKPRIDNTYFVGNCFGSISPGLGFGQFAAMLTGIYAAMDICGLGKYEELVKPLFDNYNNSLVLRRFLEGLDDTKLDFLIKNLDNKLTNNLIDFTLSKDSNFELLKNLTPVIETWNSFHSKNLSLK